MAKAKQVSVPRTLDPLRINERVYHHCSKLLDELDKKKNDDLSFRDRMSALVIIARIQTIFMGLRKETRDESSAGSAVRKYADAFKANAARSRKADTGPAATPFDDDDTAGIGDDEDTAA